MSVAGDTHSETGGPARLPIKVSCTGTTSPTNQPRKDLFHLYSLSPHSPQFQHSAGATPSLVSLGVQLSFNPSSTRKSRACSLTNRSRCWRGRTDRWRRPGEGWSWRPGHRTYPAGSYKKKQQVIYQKISVYGHFMFKFLF
jgi:hypothetical protein